MPIDDSFGESVAWLPTIAGAGYGVRTAYKQVVANPPHWASNTAQIAARAAETAVAQGSMETPTIESLARSRFYMENLPANMRYMAMSRGTALSFIDEATRVALLRGMSLNPSDIEVYSKRIAAAATPEDAYAIARAAVSEYGDPQAFQRVMQGALNAEGPAGQMSLFPFQAGARFTEEELRLLQSPGYAVTEEYMAHTAGAQYELGQSYLKRIPANWKASMSYYEAPTTTGGGNMFMGRLRLTHPNLPTPISVNVPLTEGWYRRGRSMQSTYVTQGVISGKDLISFGEYQMRQLTDETGLLRSLEEAELTESSLKARMRAFNDAMSQHMVYSPKLKTPGQDIAGMIQRQIATVPGLSRSDIIDTELKALYQTGRYFPTSTPATIAKGKVLAGFDPRQIWPNADVFPIEGRPLQALRAYSPTPAALSIMNAKFGPGGAFRRDVPFLHTAWWKENVLGRGQVSPQLALAYATPQGELAAKLGQMDLAEEELLVRKSAMPMYETYSTREAIISAHEYMPPALKSKVMQAIQTGEFGGPVSLKKGERLGYALGTGEEVLANGASGMTEAIVGAEKFAYGGSQTGVKLLIHQTHKPAWYAKLFGQLKMTTRAREDKVLNTLAEQMGIPFLADGVDGFAYAEGLRKNRAYLRMQMQSGLGMLSAKALEAGSLAPAHAAEVKAFLAGGWEWAAENAATETDVLRLALKWGIPTGPIGGMLPHALPAEMYSKVLEGAAPDLVQRTLLAASLESSPFVLGLASPAVGGFRYTGGGGRRATMEPRGFVQLMARGDRASQELAGEMARSMRGYGAEIGELNQVISSMAGQAGKNLPVVKIGDVALGRNAGDVSVMANQGLLRKQGYLLDLGKKIEAFGGVSQVYVPGAGQLRQLGRFRYASGEVRAQSLLESYHELASAVQNSSDTLNSAKAIETSARGLRKSILESMSVALAGRSQGGPRGALRGRMVGSMALAPSTIDPALGAVTADTVELSRAAATDMFDDMFANAATAEESAFIREQRAAFFKGERIAAGAGRHGLIGPWSIQPTWARLAQGPESEAGEYFVRMPAPQREAITLTKGVAGVKSFEADISPLLGMAADFDDDRIITKLIGSRKVDDALTKELRSGHHMMRYRQFAAEAGYMQVLAKNRARASATDIVAMADTDRLIMGSAKLRVGVGGELARMSNALSEAKLAMAIHKPDMAYKFNVLAEIMEQQTISGKHMRNLDLNVGAQVADAIKHIDTAEGRTGLGKAIEQVFGKEINQAVELNMAGKAWTFSGVPTESMVNDVSVALSKFRTGPESVLYNQMIKGVRGQAEISIREMKNMLDQARAGRIEPLTTLAMREARIVEGAGTKIVRDTVGSINAGIKEAGSMARSFGKPLLYGLAGTTALALLLGAPKAQPMTPPPAPAGMTDGMRRQVMDGAQVASAKMRESAPLERDLRPESMPIGDSVVGRPTAPGMATPSTYMTRSPGYSFNVRARSGRRGAPDQAAIASALGRAAPGSSIRVTYNDNRRPLTAQKLSEMLEGF